MRLKGRLVNFGTLADEYASTLKRGMASDYAMLRDVVDTLSLGDLDCTQLDILTDMVRNRLLEK